MFCGVAWHSMVGYMVWYDMVRYGMAWHGMIWYGIVWYGISTWIMWYGIMYNLSTVLYFILDCVAPVPLGMSNGHISDIQIIESTAANRETPGRLARLDNTNTYYSGAWTADHMDANKWLQVDFLMSTVVTMVVTQGRSDGNFWVTTYVLSYSDDGHLFRNYTESGIRKVNGQLNSMLN